MFTWNKFCCPCTTAEIFVTMLYVLLPLVTLFYFSLNAIDCKSHCVKVEGKPNEPNKFKSFRSSCSMRIDSIELCSVVASIETMLKNNSSNIIKHCCPHLQCFFCRRCRRRGGGGGGRHNIFLLSFSVSLSIFVDTRAH